MQRRPFCLEGFLPDNLLMDRTDKSCGHKDQFDANYLLMLRTFVVADLDLLQVKLQKVLANPSSTYHFKFDNQIVFFALLDLEQKTKL